GITNDSRDPCVDTFGTGTLPMLKHFSVVARGAPPLGGSEVVLKVPIVPKSLTAATWVDEGMVKCIRGVSYSTRISPHMANRMVDAARGVLNHLLSDAYIFTNHYTGSESGKSLGYGISLVAETTTGCILSSECVATYSGAYELQLLEDLGMQAAMSLLQEIKLGGVVDSTHQGLLFILCALCPKDVSKVRVGKLS
ncbi:hypothetical protein SELMODRAFT_4441, partial [Selaginella moellendorffii]